MVLCVQIIKYWLYIFRKLTRPIEIIVAYHNFNKVYGALCLPKSLAIFSQTTILFAFIFQHLQNVESLNYLFGDSIHWQSLDMTIMP